MTILFAFEAEENWDDGNPTFWASSQEFWNSEHRLDDQFREVDVPSVANTMEACFEINRIHIKTREQAKHYLEHFGLVFSQEMQDFIAG